MSKMSKEIVCPSCRTASPRKRWRKEGSIRVPEKHREKYGKEIRMLTCPECGTTRSFHDLGLE